MISFEKPLSLKGNVHRFGDKVRIQVFLDGGSKTNRTQKVCWLVEHDFNTLENLPDSIRYLAHNIYMELGYDFECKSVKDFESFTNGLNKHIEYMEKGEVSCMQDAISSYEETNRSPGGNNPYANYQIARLLYYQYNPLDNETCIEKFKNVLNTSNTTLRAHAYRGLANAYCQKNQRHNVKEPYLLQEAIRFAEMAYGATAKKSEKDEQIVKALAYTYQVLAENEQDNEKREKNLNEAKLKYKEAISINHNFTIAYNNLGYIHLKEAERNEGGEHSKTDIDLAIKYFQKAVKSNPTYPHAYDNLGNAHQFINDWNKAEEFYLLSIDYKSDYLEAKKDLAEHYMKWLSHRENRHIYSDDYLCYKSLQYHNDTLELVKNDSIRIKDICSDYLELVQSCTNLTETFDDNVDTWRKKLSQNKCSCIAKNGQKQTIP